jgi:glycosyltransferase-like protein
MTALSIGVFTYSTRPRGSVVHAAHLAEALHDAGQRVTLYALDKEGGGFFRPLRVPFVRVPARSAEPGSDALIAQRIAETADFIAAARPGHQLVHAQDCLVASGLIAARAALQGAVLCRTVHHVEEFESPYLQACQARSIREADLVLSVSAATRADVLRCYGRESLRVESGVDYARFAQAGGGAELRQRLGISVHAKLLLSVGGVEPRKNSQIMLEAFARAHQAQPELRWLIAGGASIFEHAAYRAAFDAQLAALPASTRAAIIRLGVLDDRDMPALYAACDGLLHASLHEGFGLCVLEAMAANRPVLVSQGAPFDEYLDDTCAMRVDPRDVAALTDGIGQLCAPDPRRVEAARARALQFDWARCAARHVALYRSALSGPRARSAVCSGAGGLPARVREV